MLKPFNPDFPAISGPSLFGLDKFGMEVKYSVQILGCDERCDGQVRLIRVGDDHEASRPSHLICPNESTVAPKKRTAY